LAASHFRTRSDLLKPQADELHHGGRELRYSPMSRDGKACCYFENSLRCSGTSVADIKEHATLHVSAARL
jgi:hypothetical protein